MPDARWFQKILVATDFSEHSTAALREAVALAKLTGGQVTLVHVLSNLRAAMADMSKVSRWHLVDDIEAFERQLRASSDKKLRAQAAELSREFPGIQIQTLVGTPYIELIHAVQAQGHDLALCGTRGQAGWKRFLVGSTSDRLIRNCPCPVWVVKGEGGKPPQTILVAIDLSPPSGRALEAAAWLAGRAGAGLHVLHVVDERDVPDLPEGEGGELELPPPLSRRQVNRAALERVEAFLAELALPVSAELHIGHGDAWKVIGATARKLSADLLAMGTIGRHGLPGLLLGSTTERVLHTAAVSLLTIKPADFRSPVDPAFWELPEPARV
jgi:nucleotide-binding universal stress UspA family protein